jgi:hypothetical protein
VKRVYVAGAYSDKNVLGVFSNMNKGMRMSTEVLLAGYAPYCPWLDFHFYLMLREDESVNLDTIYAYSMAWLEASAAVLVVPGYEKSKGTLAEIKRARQMNIPVYYSLESLMAHEPRK